MAKQNLKSQQELMSLISNTASLQQLIANCVLPHLTSLITQDKTLAGSLVRAGLEDGDNQERIALIVKEITETAQVIMLLYEDTSFTRFHTASRF